MITTTTLECTEQFIYCRPPIGSGKVITLGQLILDMVLHIISNKKPRAWMAVHVIFVPCFACTLWTLSLYSRMPQNHRGCAVEAQEGNVCCCPPRLDYTGTTHTFHFKNMRYGSNHTGHMICFQLVYAVHVVFSTFFFVGLTNQRSTLANKCVIQLSSSGAR